MKKLALAGLVLAASIGTAGVAVAAEPAADVKVALCANVSVASVSGAADVAASRAQRDLDAAKAALEVAKVEQDRRAKVLADAEAALAQNPTSETLKAAVAAAKVANEAGNAARAAADQKVKDLEARLANALVDQREAVALEGRVAAFVGSESFDVVKRRHCDPPATTVTPTPTPTPSTVTTVIKEKQIVRVPNRVDTGRA